MSFIIGAIKVIFLLGFLVFIHEGGHFLVAKKCKIFVKEFSIGFGPKIFSWTGKETKYSIRLIPLGGYVSMLGEEERSDEEGSFSKASVLKRALIVLAGPIVNIVFGLIVYFILISFSGNNATTVIKDFYDKNGVVAQDLQVGDEILELNGKKVHTKLDLDRIMLKSAGDNITVKVKRGDSIIEKAFKPTVIETKALGIYFSTSSDEPKVKYVEDETSAKSSGIQVGDVITKINDTEIKEYKDISDAINSADSETVRVEVRRNIETFNFNIKPTIQKTYFLGVYLEKADENFSNNTYYAYWRTLYFAGDLLNNVKRLFTGGISIDQMTGPIGISEMVVETNGVYDFVYLMCMISLSLGITNLLPIPALDGGRLLLLIVEAIRRKPLSEDLELKIQMIGFTVLIMFSIYVSYKDILRIF